MGLITAIKSAARTVGIFCKNYSPEILMAAGTVAFGATVVMVVKESQKQEQVNDFFSAEKEEIQIEKATNEDYSEWQYKKEITGCYIRFVGRTAWNYAPAIGLGSLSLSCFFGAYGILKKRNIALLAAYNAVNEAFQAYRKRVIEKEGADADLFYMTGQKLKTITVVDEDGTKHKEKMLVDGSDPKALYAFKFGKYKENGERNQQWSDADPLFNDMYIRGMQNKVNDDLWLRTIFDDRTGDVIQPGHVFLNEIRDLMGEDHNVVGSVVGNLYSPNHVEGCDGYINFNAVKSSEIDPETGKEIDCWWIFPNVDGVIYDMLDQWKKVKKLPLKDESKEYAMSKNIQEGVVI